MTEALEYHVQGRAIEWDRHRVAVASVDERAAERTLIFDHVQSEAKK
jgi:hypothetical protein